jgi:hypothetical protein
MQTSRQRANRRLMQIPSDRNKTLQELETGVSKPTDEPAANRFDHPLRHKPLRDFTTEDLRIAINQHIGLPFLIPIAIERLELNPFARGEQHLGDLLLSILKVKTEFWRGEPQLLWRFQEVLIKLVPILQSLQAEISNFINRDDRFKRPDA